MNTEKNIIKIVGQLTNQLCDCVDLMLESFDNLPTDTHAEAAAIFAKINNAKENLQNTVFMKEIYPKVATYELNENTDSESPCKAKREKSFDSNALKQTFCDIISQEADQELF